MLDALLTHFQIGNIPSHFLCTLTIIDILTAGVRHDADIKM